MENLKDLTMTQVVNFYADSISKDKDISKSLAKKLFLNALMYNLVYNEIEHQINFLMGIDDDELEI